MALAARSERRVLADNQDGNQEVFLAKVRGSGIAIPGGNPGGDWMVCLFDRTKD